MTQQPFDPRFDLDPFATLTTFDTLICDNLIAIGVNAGATVGISSRYNQSVDVLFREGEAVYLYNGENETDFWFTRLTYRFLFKTDINGIMLFDTGSCLDGVDMTIEQFITYCNVVKMIKENK